MTFNYSVWKIDPFGPSKDGDDAGVIFSGIGELFKMFMAPPSAKKRENDALEDKLDLNELHEAGIETSLMNVVGCNKCKYKEKCLMWNLEAEQIREAIVKEYGVIVVLRCPILMRELEK